MASFMRVSGMTRSVLTDAELVRESEPGSDLLGESPDGGLDDRNF